MKRTVLITGLRAPVACTGVDCSRRLAGGSSAPTASATRLVGFAFYQRLLAFASTAIKPDTLLKPFQRG